MMLRSARTFYVLHFEHRIMISVSHDFNPIRWGLLVIFSWIVMMVLLPGFSVESDVKKNCTRSLHWAHSEYMRALPATMKPLSGELENIL